MRRIRFEVVLRSALDQPPTARPRVVRLGICSCRTAEGKEPTANGGGGGEVPFGPASIAAVVALYSDVLYSYGLYIYGLPTTSGPKLRFVGLCM